ncbi:MAG: Flp family type IVb pilin [Hyphomicrobium sp.]
MGFDRGIWSRFWSDEQGATANEYALIAIICSVSIIAGLYGQRDGINKNLGEATAGLQAGNAAN